jgi:hypothetical protein
MRIIAIVAAALVALAAFSPQAAQAQAQPAAPGMLGVIHAAPGSPAVDVYVDGVAALTSRDYFSAGMIDLTPGTHQVAVVAEGASPSSVLVGKTVTVDPGEGYTLTLIGAPGEVTGLLTAISTSQPEADEARVRIINASLAGPVDMALADVAEPFLNDAAFGSATYIDVPAGTYAYDLTDATTGADLLRTVELTFNAGWTYTLVVTGANAKDVWLQSAVDRVGS